MGARSYSVGPARHGRRSRLGGCLPGLAGGRARHRIEPAGRRRLDRLVGLRLAWRDYGEVILCDGEDEMVAEADRIAAEHVEVMTSEPRRWLDRLKNYGALFLDPETNVSYGDEVIGTNQ